MSITSFSLLDWDCNVGDRLLTTLAAKSVSGTHNLTPTRRVEVVVFIALSITEENTFILYNCVTFQYYIGDNSLTISLVIKKGNNK